MHDIHSTWRDLAELRNERFDRLAAYLDDIQQGSFFDAQHTDRQHTF
jgi:hypothetical protein